MSSNKVIFRCPNINCLAYHTGLNTDLKEYNHPVGDSYGCSLECPLCSVALLLCDVCMDFFDGSEVKQNQAWVESIALPRHSTPLKDQHKNELLEETPDRHQTNKRRKMGHVGVIFDDHPLDDNLEMTHYSESDDKDVTFDNASPDGGKNESKSPSPMGAQRTPRREEERRGHEDILYLSPCIRCGSSNLFDRHLRRSLNLSPLWPLSWVHVRAIQRNIIGNVYNQKKHRLYETLSRDKPNSVKRTLFVNPMVYVTIDDDTSPISSSSSSSSGKIVSSSEESTDPLSINILREQIETLEQLSSYQADSEFISMISERRGGKYGFSHTHLIMLQSLYKGRKEDIFDMCSTFLSNIPMQWHNRTHQEQIVTLLRRSQSMKCDSTVEITTPEGAIQKVKTSNVLKNILSVKLKEFRHILAIINDELQALYRSMYKMRSITMERPSNTSNSLDKLRSDLDAYEKDIELRSKAGLWLMLARTVAAFIK
ncbi:hypothetical protein PROFUN_02420 [Planoprotostelium fungivorum]|uniref:Uncharacterized protein n=1 Tax=Planoprotostelium fungivorum TaxID=1890364 RepID=A0A2P6NUX4_9EUKA|nr:hypothetical protein PROFUN_02420 [Planoprotostelium fungivorum]